MRRIESACLLYFIVMVDIHDMYIFVYSIGNSFKNYSHYKLFGSHIGSLLLVYREKNVEEIKKLLGMVHCLRSSRQGAIAKDLCCKLSFPSL